jgi:hypothetical protein
MAWGAVSAPWQSVLLKHPGAVPAGAGAEGWLGGFAEDPKKWQPEQTGAFPGSVVVCVDPDDACQGLAGCGALTPWQVEVKQETPDPPPAKLFPWQIWHAAKPEFPGALLAVAPWLAGKEKPGTVPWWHADVKQEVLAIPPCKSSPWHDLH